MKTKVLLLAFLMMGATSFGQKLIDTKKVPDNVKRTLKKKASRATDVKWFKDGHDYIAKYKLNDQPSEAHINMDAILTLLKTKVDPRKLPSAIQKDLSQRHKKKKIYEAYSIVKSRRDKYYSIILHKSQGRKKPPLVYEVQYTFQGKYITTFEPEIEIVEEEATGPSKFDKDVDKDMDKLKEKVRDEKVKRKDLPSKIETYLKANFDHEYTAKEIFLKSNTKYGQYYYIVMKKQGEKKKFIHFFDLEGNLLKKRVETL